MHVQDTPHNRFPSMEALLKFTILPTALDNIYTYFEGNAVNIIEAKLRYLMACVKHMHVMFGILEHEKQLGNEKMIVSPET